MSTISTALRNFKEPTKDELNRLFFSLPPEVQLPSTEHTEGRDDEVSPKGMDINAVLSLGPDSAEDPYVRRMYCL